MLPSTDKAAPTSAILLVFAAGLMFCFLDTSAKYLVLAGVPALFVTWVRYAVHLVLVLVLFRGWRDSTMFRSASLPKQTMRALCLFGSTVLNFLALKTLQLAEAQSINFFGPMLITALAGPLLGEWAGWRRWAAILVGFAGVLIITRPGFGTFQAGHLFMLGAMACNSVYVIFTRSMSRTETGTSMIFYSALMPTLLLIPTVPFTATMPPSYLHVVLLLSLGIFGGFGHWFLIKAYSRATTTALAPYPYLQIVWMTVSGYVVFDQLPDAWTLTGAGIIVLSGLYIVHREHRLRLAERSMPHGEDRTLAKKL